MFLPTLLQQNLDQLLEPVQWKDLKKSTSALSSLYREGKGVFLEQHALGYLAARLPATYAVCLRVLQQFKEDSFHSCLDLGSGPGTAAWAAASLFNALTTITLVEKEPWFAEIGKRLAREHPLLSQATWKIQDLRTFAHFPRHDLVILSYTYGEFQDETVLKRAWESAEQALVFIEPGTPRGFSHLLQARKLLVSWGAHLWAPCPHMNQCPLLATSEWCHFAARIERSSLHRYTKEASLPYEDEKFCYLIAKKTPVGSRFSRLLHSPQKHSGHVDLTLCTEQGIQKLTLSRKQKDLYKQARKLSWGETWIE